MTRFATDEVSCSWIADSFNVNTCVSFFSTFNPCSQSSLVYRWMIASSMIQLGLSWWQAWICVWVGYTLSAPFIVLNARPGAIFHITFPVVARTSFGLYGSLWCTFNRGVMAWCVLLLLKVYDHLNAFQLSAYGMACKLASGVLACS